ncbi:MAG: hypothetical protein IID44_17610 [Planctomycetes bacterium]|nr:hypothetical protein [Planctomycetota bacterium]
MAESPRHKRAQEQNQKLSLYRISLAFAVLGLATQTASFGAFVIADIVELLAWLSLLVSGMTAIERIDNDVHYDLLLDAMERHGELKDAFSKQSGQLLKTGRILYNIHHYCFVGGFTLLALARGVSPIVGIYERIVSKC